MNKLGLTFLLMLSVVNMGFSQQPSEAEINKTVKEMKLKALTREQPVAMDAKLFSGTVSEKTDNFYYVVVKINIMDGWHNYAYVPDGGYFYTSKLSLMCNGKPIAAKILKEPGAVPYEADHQLLIYKGQLVFVYQIDKSSLPFKEDFDVSVVYDYQACDPYICLPPKKIKKDLFEFTVEKNKIKIK